jgi:hypothetical protein
LSFRGPLVFTSSAKAWERLKGLRKGNREGWRGRRRTGWRGRAVGVDAHGEVGGWVGAFECHGDGAAWAVHLALVVGGGGRGAREREGEGEGNEAEE